GVRATVGQREEDVAAGVGQARAEAAEAVARNAVLPRGRRLERQILVGSAHAPDRNYRRAGVNGGCGQKQCAPQNRHTQRTLHNQASLLSGFTIDGWRTLPVNCCSRITSSRSRGTVAAFDPTISASARRRSPTREPRERVTQRPPACKPLREAHEGLGLGTRVSRDLAGGLDTVDEPIPG